MSAAAPVLHGRDAPRRARGFTLLEVLVALVVVALGMSALLETLTQSANNVAALREKTVAEWIAMNQVALARLALNAPSPGITQGDVQSCANGNWHWQQQVSAVDAVPGLLSITVSVQRTGNATPNANQGHAAPPAGATPGATGQLGANVALGPTAALGSVSSLSTAGCASFLAPGNSLGSGSGPDLGAMPSLGGSALGASTPGAGDAANVSGSTAASLSNTLGNAGSSGNPGSWLVTVTGFRGSALGAASGESPDWAGAGFATNSNGNATSTPTNPGLSGGITP